MNSTISVVESTTVNLDLSNSFAFRIQIYIIAAIKLYPITKYEINIYIDNRYSITFINIFQFLSILTNIHITKILTPLKVRDVGISKHETLKYVTILIYLPTINKLSKSVLVHFRKELYFINDLRFKILIVNNNVSLVDIIINLD